MRAVYVCFLLGALSACQTDRLSAVPAAGGAFALEVYTTFGERVTECTGQPGAAVTDQLRVPDIRAQIENSIAKKRLAHDEVAGKACTDALKTVACDDLLDLFAEGKGACDLAYVGLVDIDGDCYQGNECKPGHFCELVGDCLGACRKYVKVGGACGSGTACEPDSQCIGGLCRERAGDGEVCGGEIRIGCKQGLLCLPNSPTTGTCIKGVKDGECTSSSVCALGYQCVAANEDATSGNCVPVKREGEACTEGLNQCVFYTSCSEGTCKVWGGEGSACGVVGKEHDVRCFQAWCGAENEADAEAGIGSCRALVEDGGACNDDSQCVNGFCDFFANGLCVSACAPQ